MTADATNFLSKKFGKILTKGFWTSNRPTVTKTLNRSTNPLISDQMMHVPARDTHPGPTP